MFVLRRFSSSSGARHKTKRQEGIVEWRTLRFVHVTQLCRTSPALGVVMTLFSDPDILGWGGNAGKTQVIPSLLRLGFWNCNLRFVILIPISSYFTAGWTFLSYSHPTTPSKTPSQVTTLMPRQVP